MTTQPAESTLSTADEAERDVPAASPAPTDPLWVERTGNRTYTGHSARGAQVSIGPASEGAVFTPGELLKIALAACAGMSTDRTFARRLGDDYRVTIHVEGAKLVEEDRYPKITGTYDIDLTSLDDDARDRLITVAERAIDKACTVGRTVKAGAEVEYLFQPEGAGREVETQV